MRSSTDIVSISTGRETILIGPLSAFGAQAASVVLRDRFSIIQALEVFASRPNAEQLIRPHLRRWGVDPVSMRVVTRQTMVHALAKLASTGAIGVSKVPDVTLSFAGASLDEEFKQVSVKPIAGGALPPDLSDRMMLVFEMAPQYMEGETRLAFENAVRDLGMGLIVGAVVAWVGAHFIPGVNIAMLAFDLFFLSTAVLHALERAHEIVGDVRDAKSRAELKPAAIAMAAVLSILIVEGVLGRLLKAKSLTKGVGKKGGHSDAKPSLGKKKEVRKSRGSEKRLREPDPPSKESSKPAKRSGQGPAKTRSEFDEKYGSKFASKDEADAAWRVYEQSSNSDAELVIGRQKDTSAGGELGMTYLNDPDWTPKVNDAFIQGAIDSKKPLYLGSTPNDANLISPPGSEYPTTVFKREMDQLIDAGYRQVGDYMLPPD